jgi:hypothetical protein
MGTMNCFNCAQEISDHAFVCPFCRLYARGTPGSYGYPSSLMPPAAPAPVVNVTVSARPTSVSGGDFGGGVGLLTALRNFFFGDPEVPRLNKVRSNEATYTVKNLPGCVDGGTGLRVPRKWCEKCGNRYNELEASRCSHCKRKFVETYIVG